jgi:microcystin degradation protein MlrC
MPPRVPRITVGGFMIESHSHAPVATAEEFAADCDLAGAALEADWRAPHPRGPATFAGFVAAMDARGPWTALPLRHAQVDASGPVEQAFLDAFVDDLCARLRAALPVDGVFLSLHGAAIATVDPDPEGTVLERVRAIVGRAVPVVATLDLHGNVVARMVEHADLLVAYRTNPHVDLAERGADCAAALHEMLAGMRPASAFVKLPFVPPSVTQGTASGPYRELLDYGQSQRGPRVVDVSILSGFTLGDTPKNGMSVIVTTRGDAALARGIARRVAQRAWDGRHAWVPRLTPIADAVALALAAGRDVALPPLLLADVADNPGGGGRGNTVWLLEALLAAGVEGAVLGPFFDPALVDDAHRLGEGAAFRARLNRDEAHPLSGRIEADAVVERLDAGPVVGRRGIAAGQSIDDGPTALLRLGGLRLVATGRRDQARDPVQFERLGVDLRAVRTLVVKSRGHFRAAFDEVFADGRIVEVDAPGLTTPVLANVPWRRIPRPIFPLDPDTAWSAD